VLTGKPDPAQTDTLESGVLEISPDGKTFNQVAQFAGGEAHAELHSRQILAVRIRPTSQQRHPLAIRELTIVSDVPVLTFKFPVEIEVDCSDSPEMKDWAERAARLCERWYPAISEALASDGFKPPHHIKMKISRTYDGVAAAGGDEIIGSTRYFTDHPDDVGALIHETTHVVQNYGGHDNPGWLVEGVADFVRFFLFEPKNIGPIRARGARYDAGYRTTAAFLAYVSRRYDKTLVSKLNSAMRTGKYRPELFQELTGKTAEELDNEWRQTLRR
jgi:hypothetical protein